MTDETQYAQRVARLRRLDAAVAREVFGFWTAETEREYGDGSKKMATEWWGRCNNTECPHPHYAAVCLPYIAGLGHTQGWSEDGLPRFSSDYPTAWSLMLHYRDRGWDVTISGDKANNETGFRAIFGPILAIDDSPAEAISHAALGLARWLASIAGQRHERVRRVQRDVPE